MLPKPRNLDSCDNGIIEFQVLVALLFLPIVIVVDVAMQHDDDNE
jgi:hypothetical protein